MLADASFGRSRAAPVIVGGLGGSGTRVVAELALALGWYFGRDLNTASDNLLFTLLFRRPHWYARVADAGDEVELALHTFDRLMSGQPLTASDQRVLGMAIADAVRYGRANGTPGDKLIRRVWDRTVWPVWRGMRAQLPSKVRGLPDAWGFKEPNAHLYLPHLVRHYPELRYVHVVRHGLDMALSSNQTQLYNWGWLYDPAFVLSRTAVPSPVMALDFWLQANERSIANARQMLPASRFLLLNYDDLCARPREGVETLCRFLGRQLDDAALARLAAIPKAPSSTGRHREVLARFEPRQVEAVRRLGFTVDGPG